jgi:hypothetical protein
VTTGVCAEDAGVPGPAEFDAVTTTRNVNETSAACTTYVEPVAPEIAAQFAPPESQRFHTYAYPVGPFDHDPVLAVNVCPETALPETVGGAVFTGGDGGGGGVGLYVA